MCAVRRRDMDVASANTAYVQNKRAFLVTSLHEQRSDSLAQRVKRIRTSHKSWIPAFAGMTSFRASRIYGSIASSQTASTPYTQSE